jgi:hypothetical protein
MIHFLFFENGTERLYTGVVIGAVFSTEGFKYKHKDKLEILKFSVKINIDNLLAGLVE